MTALPLLVIGCVVLAAVVIVSLVELQLSRASARTALPPGPYLSSNAMLVAFFFAAMSELVRSMTARGHALPDINALFIENERIVLHVAAPPEEAPSPPWHIGDAGRDLVVAAADLRRWDRMPCPFPALTVMGFADGWWVLVDLEQAPGLISVIGDRRLARRVVKAIAFELSNNPWSADCDVIMVGFATDRRVTHSDRIRYVDSISEALGDADQSARTASIVLGHLGVPNIATGRLSDSGSQRGRMRAHVVICAQPPAENEADRIMRLLGDAHSPVVMMCVGDSSLARWRFEAIADRQLRLGQMNLGVVPVVAAAEEHEAQLEAARAVVTPSANTVADHPSQGQFGAPEAVETACVGQWRPHPLAVEEAAPMHVDRAGTAKQLDVRFANSVPAGPSMVSWPNSPPVEPAAGDAGDSLRDPALGAGRRERALPRHASAADPPAVLHPVDALPEPWLETIRELRVPVVDAAARGRLWPAVVDVRLLGPAEVAAPGPVDPAWRPSLTELAIAASVEPDAVAESLLQSYRFRGGDAIASALVENLRAWLGTADDGAPRLRQCNGGGWTLAPDVRVDWRLFRALVAPGDQDNERARLVTALALIRGRPSAWITATPETVDEMDGIVTAAALRAARLAVIVGDVGNAEWSLRQALALRPDADILQRELGALYPPPNPGRRPFPAEQQSTMARSGFESRDEHA